MDGLVVGPQPGLMCLEGWWPSSVTTRPQKSRDRICSRPLCLQLPCEGLEQPLLQERKDAFLRLCQARVYQGCQHCHEKNCTFLVLSMVFSTPGYAHCWEREGGNSLSQQLCLHGAGQSPVDGAGQGSQAWDRLPLQRHRKDQGSQGTGQAGTPVT